MPVSSMFVSELEKYFGINLDDAPLEKIVTVGDLDSLVCAQFEREHKPVPNVFEGICQLVQDLGGEVDFKGLNKTALRRITLGDLQLD